MPALYPPTPRFPPDDGGAEHAVHTALADQLPDDAVLFHGLHIQDQHREHEIDLLIAWPGHGLAAIEVKGGHITRDQGAWLQGRPPNTHPIDPFTQVQDARHALTRWLAAHGATTAARVRTAHLAAFPHTRIAADWDLPEAPRAMILDRDDLATAATRVRDAIDAHGAGHAVPTEDDVVQLVALLAGAFPAQVDALTAAAEHEDRIDQLTREQGHILDLLRNQNRIRIIGAAGSGKTWLALEQARRRAKAGERVALLCYSRGLGRYLERVTATWPAGQRPAFVGLFHELPVQWGAGPGADDDADDWEYRLPTALGELAATRPRGDLFDAVVVDEAQDFGALWWPSLLRCLRDPRGGLFVFMDESQHVFARDGDAPIDLPPYELSENLRSTKQIAQLFGAFSETEVRPRGLPGAPARVVDVPYDGAIAAADDAVEALLDEGWEPGQIALLATGRRHPEQAQSVEAAGHAAYWDDFFAGTDVFYGHVLGFKGLERTVVVLAVNGFREEERARKLLYTGLSRARVLVVVVGPLGEITRLGGEGVRRRLHDAVGWSPGR